MHVTEIVWPWQLGDAVTLPWFTGALIGYKSPEMLTSSKWRFIRVHEHVHVAQMRRLGRLGYLWHVVILARIKQRSIFAVCSPWEQEAYRAAGQLDMIAKCGKGG